jgi:hypothetical protein
VKAERAVTQEQGYKTVILVVEGILEGELKKLN